MQPETVCKNKDRYTARFFITLLNSWGLLVLFIVTSPGLFSQNPNRSLRDTTFMVNDFVLIPYPNFCDHPGCPDGLSFDSYDSLTLVAAFIKKYPQFVFQIETNTDQRGNADGNKALSYKQADFLKKTLITRYGVDPTSLLAMGCGETNPIYVQEQIDKLKTRKEKEKLYAQNRRTVLHIIRKK